MSQLSSTTKPPVQQQPTAKPPKREPRPEAAPYVMPQPIVSKIVMWFPDRFEKKGYPAIVTEVGDRAVSLSIILPNQYAISCKTGVRHRTDPDKAIVDLSEDGIWDFAAESDEELSRVLHRLERVEEALAALTRQGSPS